jgi:hypothetical protein
MITWPTPLWSFVSLRMLRQQGAAPMPPSHPTAKRSGPVTSSRWTVRGGYKPRPGFRPYWGGAFFWRV